MSLKLLKRLGRKHLLFIDAYVRTKNASEAAVIAGFKPSNKSNTSCLLMQQPLIREAISKKFKLLELTEEEIKALYLDVIQSKEEATKDRLHAIDQVAKIKGMTKDTTTEIHHHFDVIQEQLIKKRRNVLEQESN